MSRTLLIDGDILVVSTGAACEVETDWGDDMWTLHCDVGEVKSTILRAIEGLKRDLQADDAVVCLSMGETFRHRLTDTYKAGRGRKPVGTGEVKRWLIEEQGAKLVPGIEADDTMGILATNPRIIKGEKVIVSADKDMMTIPGLLYRDGDIMEISEELADLNWLKQTLSGDVTDGYPGCPGVGEVTAEAALKDCLGWESYEYTFKTGKKAGQTETRWRSVPMDNLWAVVVSHFVKAGLTEEDALLQARLARILRSSDFNFKNKEPILWQPTSSA